MKVNQDYFVRAVLEDYPMKSGEMHARTVSWPCQFTLTIQCVAMVTKSLGNLTKEASNEPHTHRILQMEVHATFGYLAC
jgi:hypothetical protein